MWNETKRRNRQHKVTFEDTFALKLTWETWILWCDEEVTHNITDIHYYSTKESDFNHLHIEETWILCLYVYVSSILVVVSHVLSSVFCFESVEMMSGLNTYFSTLFIQIRFYSDFMIWVRELKRIRMDAWTRQRPQIDIKLNHYVFRCMLFSSLLCLLFINSSYWCICQLMISLIWMDLINRSSDCCREKTQWSNFVMCMSAIVTYS